jgi:hypothetical protein
MQIQTPKVVGAKSRNFLFATLVADAAPNEDLEIRTNIWERIFEVISK